MEFALNMILLINSLWKLTGKISRSSLFLFIISCFFKKDILKISPSKKAESKIAPWKSTFSKLLSKTLSWCLFIFPQVFFTIIFFIWTFFDYIFFFIRIFFIRRNFCVVRNTYRPFFWQCIYILPKTLEDDSFKLYWKRNQSILLIDK